jgi:hypothetical protein
MLEKLVPAPETLSDSPTPVKTVFLPLHAETLAEAGDLYWADNPDGTRSVKGGGVVGGPTELRYWEGDVAELGPALRSDIGKADAKIVDDVMLNSWREQIVWDLHRTHDPSKNAAQIRALVANYHGRSEPGLALHRPFTAGQARFPAIPVTVESLRTNRRHQSPPGSPGSWTRLSGVGQV